jgi:hypothetical protein
MTLFAVSHETNCEAAWKKKCCVDILQQLLRTVTTCLEWWLL